LFGRTIANAIDAEPWGRARRLPSLSFSFSFFAFLAFLLVRHVLYRGCPDDG